MTDDIAMTMNSNREGYEDPNAFQEFRVIAKEVGNSY